MSGYVQIIGRGRYLMAKPSPEGFAVFTKDKSAARLFGNRDDWRTYQSKQRSDFLARKVELVDGALVELDFADKAA